MDETPHDWRMVVETNIDDQDLTPGVNGVKGNISKFWRCLRCHCSHHGRTAPSPFEKVRTDIRNDPDWMQELSCDEAIAKQVMAS